MNRWKISFFVLAGILIVAIASVFLWLENMEESGPIPSYIEAKGVTNSLVVSATKADFEGIANTFIYKATKKEPIPVTMTVEDDITLSSELIVFSYKLPVKMHFDPVVLDDGNIVLKQSSLEIGAVNLPPSTVLKALGDSVKLPEWMVVRPKEEEIFINLSDLPIQGNLKVKAKQFNLKNDEILLEIIIPET